MNIPDRTTARAVAVGYVSRLLARGYAAADAAQETSLGFCAPGEFGYEIHSGTISVPLFGIATYNFPFAEIADEARGPQQLELFSLT